MMGVKQEIDRLGSEIENMKDALKTNIREKSGAIRKELQEGVVVLKQQINGMGKGMQVIVSDIRDRLLTGSKAIKSAVSDGTKALATTLKKEMIAIAGDYASSKALCPVNDTHGHMEMPKPKGAKVRNARVPAGGCCAYNMAFQTGEKNSKKKQKGGQMPFETSEHSCCAKPKPSYKKNSNKKKKTTHTIKVKVPNTRGCCGKYSYKKKKKTPTIQVKVPSPHPSVAIFDDVFDRAGAFHSFF